MIPLEGARVRVRGGRHASREGVAVRVSDARDKLRRLNAADARHLVKRLQSKHGREWDKHWYECDVLLDGAMYPQQFHAGDLDILDKDLVRPDGYRDV